MKNIVKNMLSIVFVACMVIFAGCNDVPTAETMTSTSKAIGTATGMIMNTTKINDVARDTICNIIEEVQKCVPETNQTFEVAWTPIAKAHVEKLISEKKIDSNVGAVITVAFGTVTKGIDYIFNVRYPNTRTYKELLNAATHGFCEGLLSIFKKANVTAATSNVEYDKEAYKFLSESLSK